MAGLVLSTCVCRQQMIATVTTTQMMTQITMPTPLAGSLRTASLCAPTRSAGRTTRRKQAPVHLVYLVHLIRVILADQASQAQPVCPLACRNTSYQGYVYGNIVILLADNCLVD